MAIGKPRTNRRASGGSCSSTATKVVLVTLCVLGLLMLASNSLTSPSKTTIPINVSYDVPSSLKSNRKIPVDTTKDNHNAYEDNHSDLRIDVAPHDDDLKTRDDHDHDHDQETGQSYKLDDDRDWLAETESEPKQESAADNVVDDDAESLNDSDVGKQEAEEQQEEAKEEQEIEISTSTNEDNIDSRDEHKQKKQDIEVTEDDHKDDKQDEETSSEDDIRDLENTQEQEMNNQENNNISTENEQEQEQQEEDGPIESHSIAAETKAHVEIQEARDVRNKMEQAKIESIRVNTTRPIEAFDTVNLTVDVHDYIDSYEWGLCNDTYGTDYIPCSDNRMRRQCLNIMCLVPLPKDYKTPISWPQSRDKIWLHNMPNKALSDFKGTQNWVKVTGDFITFRNSAHHYIEFLQQAMPQIAWGKHTRVVLDIGCGVANFGGYLFDKDVLTMSFASKDDQESQIQVALERGIPAFSALMDTQRLPFPSRVFDLVHCVRCTVPWHKDGGILLLEANRLLRPGGYFVWSAAPVYGTLEQDIQVWKEMSALTVALCWELVTINKDKSNVIGVAIYRKPDSNECYNVIKRPLPPMCKPDDDPNFAWYVPLQTCIHMVPMGETERGSHWPEEWPIRLQQPPYWLNKYEPGVYGKPAPIDFIQDYEHWKQVITKTYMNNLGINWSNVRNVMDMRAGYGGFAAALKDLKLWVMNVVNIDSHDTLPIIFERGLVGIYHDWCETFSTYPRTYDLLHADHLFSKVRQRCRIKGVMAEIDRILRPEGTLIARDEPSMITEMEKLLKSLDWEVNVTYVNTQEGVISGRKSLWRPSTYIIADGLLA